MTSESHLAGRDHWVAHIVEAEPGQTQADPGQKALCGYRVRGILAPDTAPRCVVCVDLADNQQERVQ